MATMRDAFGDILVELAQIRDDFVVLDADVAGGTGTLPFRERFPERFIQCGIAEQNMMSAAAGISDSGLIPVVTCYAVFATMRALDQMRNSIAYPRFNVKIVASHLGLDVGPDGPTHQCIEDLAIVRSIPNMTVVAPADPSELEAAFRVVLDYVGPVYLRTGRSPVPDIIQPGITFKLGEGRVLREGADATIIAVGVMVHRALAAAALLDAEGISCRVVDMASIKPLDAELVIDCARRTGAIVTAEDHNILGGLGGAVAEVLVEHCPVPMERVGLRDRFAESGESEDLARAYNLMPDDISRSVRQVVDRRLGRPVGDCEDEV